MHIPSTNVPPFLKAAWIKDAISKKHCKYREEHAEVTLIFEN